MGPCAIRVVRQATRTMRTARETSPRRRAITDDARVRDSRAARASAATQRRRPASTATDGRPHRTTASRSSISAFLRNLLDGFFRLADVVQCQLALLNQPRHYRFRMTVKQCEQVIDQPGVRLIAGNDGFEDVRV